MTVEVVVENKAQDSAYPGKVIVSYPSVMDYTTSNQVIVENSRNKSALVSQYDFVRS